MKKIFLLSFLIISTIFIGQIASAEVASLSVLPASASADVNAPINISVKINPAGNKVCVVKGTLVFNNLSCSSISVTSGLIAQTTPTCQSPSFTIGIPNCATDTRDILVANIFGSQSGQASVNFSAIRIIGAGVNLDSSSQGGTYTINDVVAEAPKVVTVKPKTAPKVVAEEPKEEPVVVENKEPEQNIIPEGAGLASANSTMQKFMNSPIAIVILIIIIIALLAPWLYKKFYKKNKVG